VAEGAAAAAAADEARRERTAASGAAGARVAALQAQLEAAQADLAEARPGCAGAGGRAARVLEYASRRINPSPSWEGFGVSVGSARARHVPGRINRIICIVPVCAALAAFRDRWRPRAGSWWATRSSRMLDMVAALIGSLIRL
jgi:hypothetical protein